MARKQKTPADPAAAAPLNLNPMTQITAENPPPPVEYDLSPESIAVLAFIAAEESRIVAATAEANARVQAHEDALRIEREGLQRLRGEQMMVWGSRHALESGVRVHRGVGEDWSIVGDKLIRKVQA